MTTYYDDTAKDYAERAEAAAALASQSKQQASTAATTATTQANIAVNAASNAATLVKSDLQSSVNQMKQDALAAATNASASATSASTNAVAASNSAIAAQQAADRAMTNTPVVLSGPPTTSTQATLGKLGLWHDTANDANHLYHLAYITTSENLTSYHWEECVLVSNAGQAGGVVTIGQDGKISASILPLPGSSTLGGVAVSSTGANGVSASNTGVLGVVKASNAEIDAMADDYKAIVPSNLDYAVAAALSGTNHMTLSAAQQAVAQEVLGVTGGGGGGGLEPLTGHGAPTGSTAAAYGQLYKDLDTGRIYLCINAVTQNSATTTTWLELVLSDQKGAANGVASLGSDGKVPSAQLPTIPTQLSQLTEDTTHRVVTDAEKTAWSNKSDFSGSYNDLSNKPTIPTALSQLTDDATHRLVTDTEKTAWDSKSDFSGSYTDLSNKPTIPTALSQLTDDSTHRVVTDTEKTAWDNKSNFSGSYTDLTNKPSIPSTAADVGAIPATDKGANNGVAGLDANARVPLANLKYADQNSGGIVHRINPTHGLENASDWTQISRASDTDINGKSSSYKPIVPSNLDYAVRSVSKNITEIPAATSDYSLVDSSATTNEHSHVYTHVPATAPTYRLPAVTDTTIVHYIELTVDFTNVQTYSFLDSNGDAVTPLFTPTVSAGDVYTFKCEYSTVRSAWLIYPQKQGATSSDFVMKSEVGVANGVASLGNDGKVPSAQLPTIPTALSQLTDDSTHRVVTDTDITAWNGKSNFSGSYTDLTDKPTIPTALSQLTDDSTHRVVTDTEKTTWNGKSNFSGSYTDLTDKPTIPSTASDVGAIPATDKGVANGVASLDSVGKVTSSQLPTIPTALSQLTDDSTHRVVTDTEKTTWNNKSNFSGSYTDLTDKPTIPSTAADVGAIPTTDKGANNGVASLGSDGKVPSGQLPSIPPAPLVMNAAPTESTVGVIGQLAVDTQHYWLYILKAVYTDDSDPQAPVTLYYWVQLIDEDGGPISGALDFIEEDTQARTLFLTSGEVVVGYSSIIPYSARPGAIVGDNCTVNASHWYSLLLGEGLTTGNAFQFVQGMYNASVVDAFRIVGAGSSGSGRKNVEELSTAGNHYIAGGHQQKVTTIPAATSSYTLSEGVYVHTPQTASLYTLPAVSDGTRTHICIITIVFSANVLTYEFQDSNGVTQQPMPLYGTIEPGAVVTFLCRYNPVILLWSIFPVHEGVTVQP